MKKPAPEALAWPEMCKLLLATFLVGAMWSWTRLSLCYPIAYLSLSGLVYVLRPEYAIKEIHRSTAGPSEVAYQLAAASLRSEGILMLGLSFIVSQVVIHDIRSMFPVLVYVRLIFLAGWMYQYYLTKDPAFLNVLCTVLLGVVMTSASLLLERPKQKVN